MSLDVIVVNFFSFSICVWLDKDTFLWSLLPTWQKGVDAISNKCKGQSLFRELCLLILLVILNCSKETYVGISHRKLLCILDHRNPETRCSANPTPLNPSEKDLFLSLNWIDLKSFVCSHYADKASRRRPLQNGFMLLCIPCGSLGYEPSYFIFPVKKNE